MSAIKDELLGKFHRCRNHRYRVLIIIRAPLDTLFPNFLLEKFADCTGIEVVNIEESYKGRLNEFFIWQDIRNQLYKLANTQATIVTNLEPIYAKWPDHERLAFLKNILLSEPKHPLILLLTCQENLTELQDIDKSSRGIIWVPSK